MRGRRTDRRQIIICIVAVCFLIGIAVGALSQRSLDANQTERLAVYADAVKCDNTGFTEVFFKHGKYIIAIWLCGFIYSGTAAVLIIIFTAGLFYGFSASYAAAGRGMGYVLSELFVPNMLFVPLYIFTAVWTISYILRRFSNCGPKSRIRRERRKHLSEHIVVLACCMAANALGCISEMYAAGFLNGIFK